MAADAVYGWKIPPEHSRKPEYVQDMIELMYPNTKKIELFARRSREGWDVWGNETTKFDKEKREEKCEIQSICLMKTK